MRVLLLGLTFLFVLLGTAAASLPLSFAMRQSGVAREGISWQQARGTAWRGQVTGLRINGRDAGAVDIRFDPSQIMQGRLGNRVAWIAPFGSGTASASLTPTAVSLSDVRGEVQIDPSRVSSRLAPTESVLRIQGVSVELAGRSCVSASGQLSTDALAKAASSLGVAWPQLSGRLECRNGVLFGDFAGDAADGTHLQLTASQDGTGALRLSKVPEHMREAILSAGFAPEGADLVYIQARSVSGVAP